MFLKPIAFKKKNLAYLCHVTMDFYAIAAVVPSVLQLL